MSTTPVSPTDPLARILAAAPKTGRFGRHKRRLIAAALVAVPLGAYALSRATSGGTVSTLRTQEVTRGPLTVTVSASGNLQPINQVDVGSEVSGTIESISVDDNDRVRKGQVLARLDTSRLDDQVVNARAALASAEARVLQADASATETRANLARLRHVAELSGGKVPSKAELETAAASVARADADAKSARASVEQSRAALKSAETSLAKASIRSPIDGIVLARKIEPGQTVAASFQAPVLFTLAEDLTQMELQVDVDEASVGHVRSGQPATFNVDAYPRRKYPARITRVGFGSQTKDGVVSYKTVLNVTNDDLSLRPGMTATAEITTDQRQNVLLVPNAALRFTPPTDSASATKASASFVSRLLPRPPAASQPKRTNGSNGDSGASKVWVVRDGQPTAIPVSVGITDGRLTEVAAGAVQEGMHVITDAVGGQQ